MLSRLTRPQVQPPGQTPAGVSRQVYIWPRWIVTLGGSLLRGGIVGMVAGYILMLGWLPFEETSATLTGLLLAAGGGASLAAYALIHACIAREARFTHEELIVRQTGREDMVLAYASYGEHWIVDASRPKTIRVIVTANHRGCTILSPPEWMRLAFEEIERIQREEGWYEPQDSLG